MITLIHSTDSSANNLDNCSDIKGNICKIKWYFKFKYNIINSYMKEDIKQFGKLQRRDYLMRGKLKFRLVSVPIFVLEVIIYWIIFYINGYAFVNGIETVSDLLKIALVIGVVAISVSAFFTIKQTIRDFKTDGSLSKMKKTVIIIVFSVAIIMNIKMYSSLTEMGYTTAGSFSIAQKQEKGDSYYLYVKSGDGNHNVEIQCTKDVFDELIVDRKVKYTFSYRWLTYNCDKGVLFQNIDMENFIDNRR